MDERTPLEKPLPRAAGPAVEIVRRLRAAGHEALLAGGCVRDLLLGLTPTDYDVATDAVPDRVCELFTPTRQVGAQFGVVLVRMQRRWVEVATFRSEGPYLDGRHPAQVTFSDARQDALRRDFAINGMFLDPLENVVIDYVDGRQDLAARRVRAIGEPTARFHEDHLRMLRAVRLAARLGFEIEPATLAAIRENAPLLAKVAAERVREELEKMLAHASRRQAFELLTSTGLLPHLWPQASWPPDHIAAARERLMRLPREASFEAAFAALVADRPIDQVQCVCRDLTFSNAQRDAVTWLVAHQADLDEPDAIRLSDLKRRMAHPAFADLRTLVESRYAARPDGAARKARLTIRLAAVRLDQVQPPPLVTGEDLLERGVEPGPIYRQVLEELYTRQLEEELTTRALALAALDAALAARSGGGA